MNNPTWNYLQEKSYEILSDGLFHLKSRPYNLFQEVTDKVPGNYLISLDKVPQYIGEAKELAQRLRQQSKSATSTFYKNHQKPGKSNQLLRPSTIDEFKVQTISTLLGRKEMEESGIVNFPTKLNNFQLGKRKQFKIDNHNGLWDLVQKQHTDLIMEGESQILRATFVPWFDTRIVSVAGLYMVRDNSNKLIYIGESSDIGERITTHSGRTYFSALRRHIGTEILGYDLKEIQGKKRYFSDSEDRQVTAFLKTCNVTLFPVSFGRFELEEYLIRKNKPLLNRKDNKE